MIITKVILHNFKIYKHMEFEFGEKKVILLTGANGFGKTTLFDAIEWCFTGDISRLKKRYGTRNTTQSEIGRKENKKGIIKHSNSKAEDMVKVILTLKIDNIEVEVYREQKEDSLYTETELGFVGDVPLNIKEKIMKSTASDKFYTYHVCDTSKSYDFMNSKRQEIKDQFKDFIKPNPLADNFSKKLTELQERIKMDIQVLESKKTPTSTIKAVEDKINSIKVELKSIDYPQIEFYTGENLKIENEIIEKIEDQLKNIKTYGYNSVASKIESVILYYEAKDKKIIIDELFEIINAKEQDLYTAIANKYYKIENFKEIELNIKKILDEKEKVEESKRLSEINTLPNVKTYLDTNYNIKIKSDLIAELETELHTKQSEIKDKEKGNQIITALSALIINREGIIKYKNENNKRCPLCGSDEIFSNISQINELAVDAEAYLNKSESDLLSIKEAEQQVIKNINNKFSQLKQIVAKHLDNQFEILEKKRVSFNKYYEKTRVFFETLKKTDIPIDEQCIKKITEDKDELTKMLDNESAINSNIDEIRKILIVLNYNEDVQNITIHLLKKIQINIKQFCDRKLIVSGFSFKVFNQKLFFLNNILNNKTIHEKELQLKNYYDFDKEIDSKIEELNKYKESAKNIYNEIETKKAKIEKLELDAVGPYLYKIFIKVIKHTSIKKFNFNRDNARLSGGATFTDQDDNNILNILSQGQLGVFILSYFFGNMFKRKEETQFKTYFVDDITSCMDDMNVLSFVDIIKYQLYSDDRVINQFFFGTCNNDLEKLFIHKMMSFKIDLINFRFYSYGKWIKYDK